MRLTTITTTATDILTTPHFIKFTSLALLSLSLLFFTHHFFFTSSATSFSIPLQHPPHISPLPPPPPPPPPPPLPPPGKPVPEVVRTGIVDETGAMSWDFEVGEFYIEADSVDELNDLIGEVESDVNMKEKEGKEEKGVVGKYAVCDQRLRDYIPCLDNEEEITGVDNHERHCARKGLNCLVPRPKGYKTPIPWPKSQHEVWFNNMPNTHLVEGKSGQNWIEVKDDKFIFPGGDTQFPNGADNYLDQISQMVPEIAFGHHTRVALDVDCRIASFGASLMQRNVTTLSIAPKGARENQIQFALERGVPAMVAVFARRRLLYPSQAFDLIHCSRCQVNWTHDDGSLLLEANRMLRAGGYFAWAVEPQYKDGKILLQKWKEMEDLAARICWELIKKDVYITVWRKPLNNSCYLNRSAGMQPPICDANDDPDNVWFVGLSACITLLPENGYGANITTWPARLHHPPDRLQSIKMDADISKKEIYRAESKYWNDIIDSYVRVFRWKEMKLRNVMDMRAGLGGFAAALHDLQIGCWVMNIIPVSGFNTLPVIYDRGLIGVMHDWCEPFDTYPRTYDLLHAAGLFSVEQKRCNISIIMLEMDRMLRPGGRVYIRDTVSVVGKLRKIASAMGWTPALHDTSEGPHASWKILICEKRM